VTSLIIFNNPAAILEDRLCSCANGVRVRSQDGELLCSCWMRK